MKEVGGYLGLDTFIEKEYHSDVISLNSGRNALVYLFEAKKIDKIYIPYYLCDSISKTLEKNGFEFDYYHVDDKFKPKFNRVLKSNEYLFLVNYFGQFSNEKLLSFKREHGNIIVDNTQSFFQKPIDGIDTLYSCRKYFGVPDGAYLSTDDKINKEIEVDSARDRMTHILGRFETNASEFYNYFKSNDAEFKGRPLRYMSKISKNILGAIDYNKVIQKRNENYNHLESKLGCLNKLDLYKPNAPFAYPLYTENAMEIKRKLANKNIYIPTLWPNVLKEAEVGSIEYDYTANIMPLPCDQRYSVEDMQYLVKEVINCIN